MAVKGKNKDNKIDKQLDNTSETVEESSKEEKTKSTKTKKVSTKKQKSKKQVNQKVKKK